MNYKPRAGSSMIEGNSHFGFMTDSVIVLSVLQSL